MSTRASAKCDARNTRDLLEKFEDVRREESSKRVEIEVERHSALAQIVTVKTTWKRAFTIARRLFSRRL